MSEARRRLLAVEPDGAPDWPVFVDEFLREYARELAEQIRDAYSGNEPDHSWVNNPFDAADLIDPDVSR